MASSEDDKASDVVIEDEGDEVAFDDIDDDDDEHSNSRNKHAHRSPERRDKKRSTSVMPAELVGVDPDDLSEHRKRELVSNDDDHNNDNDNDNDEDFDDSNGNKRAKHSQDLPSGSQVRNSTSSKRQNQAPYPIECVDAEEWQKCELMRLLMTASKDELSELCAKQVKLAAETDHFPPYDSKDPNHDREHCDEEFEYVIRDRKSPKTRAKLLTMIFYNLWVIPESRLHFCPNTSGGRYRTNPMVLSELINGFEIMQSNGKKKRITPLDSAMAMFLMSSSPDVDSFTQLIVDIYASLVELESWKDMDLYVNVDPSRSSNQVLEHVSQKERHYAAMQQAQREEEQSSAVFAIDSAKHRQKMLNAPSSNTSIVPSAVTNNRSNNNNNKK